MKYEIDTHLFSQKLSSILIEKGMIDKKGNPDKIALYNLLYPNNKITEKDCEIDRQAVTDKTRNISNWLKGNNYPKRISDVLELCNALDCDLDYFFTDMPAPTHDTEFIATSLNISHQSVLHLLKYDNKLLELFDKLITFTIDNEHCDFIYGLLLSIYDYGMSNNVSEITIKDKLFETETSITDKETISAILSNSSHKYLDNCLQASTHIMHKKIMNLYDIKLQIKKSEIEKLQNKLKESDD